MSGPDDPRAEAPRHLTVWVVYAHPLDHPHDFVVRQWDGLDPGAAWIVPDLSTARRLIRQMAPGSVPLEPSPNDDPVVAEVWL